MASLGLARQWDNLGLDLFAIADMDRGRWGTPRGWPPFAVRDGERALWEVYSRARASTGSMRAAERAGIKPKTIPIRLAEAMASRIDCVE